MKNPNTPTYWDEQFQKEYDLIKTAHHSNAGTGYRWPAMRFEALGYFTPFRGKLLDIGCGLGNFCRYMKARNPELEIWGVDFSPKAIELAKGIEPTINYLVADAYKLPFEDNTFDVVCAQEVIEHLENPHKAIEEWKRVLKKYGELYITTPWRGSRNRELGQMFGGMMSAEHLFEWTPNEFNRNCRKHFKKVILVIPPALTDVATEETKMPYWVLAICQK